MECGIAEIGENQSGVAVLAVVKIKNILRLDIVVSATRVVVGFWGGVMVNHTKPTSQAQALLHEPPYVSDCRGRQIAFSLPKIPEISFCPWKQEVAFLAMGNGKKELYQMRAFRVSEPVQCPHLVLMHVFVMDVFEREHLVTGACALL